jgi:penicillin-binding protein 2
VITEVDFGANVLQVYHSNERLITKNPYYNSGDLIGNSVEEESYEEILRGIKEF